MTDNSSRLPSKKRLLLFRVIAMASPVILLVVLEILLRLFHYGNNLDLFIESPGNTDYYVFNPAASKRYFTNQAIATSGNSEPFKKEKGNNTLRIFILGESTTIGYPYFHNGSFHRWLLYRLMHSFPDRHFEFINCSLTAVNSYTVLGFAREVVHYQPDAVFIYTGHNEYYGVMGVGSTENMGSNGLVIGLVLWLRQFRVMQLLTNFYMHVVQLFQKRSGTRMEMMVSDQKISIHSDAYAKGIEQFRRNMDLTLKILQRNSVPVYMSTLVSNEKDQKPFVDIDQALQEYNKGLVAYREGNYATAKKLFDEASDLDGLRFRAPSAINGIIRELASKFNNVHLVDARAVFEKHSPNHIIGDELLLEHVHPNLDGYALISQAFYETMKQNHLITEDSLHEMSFQQMKLQMPVTRVDSLAALYRMGNLKRSWPFSEAMTADSMAVVSTEDRIAYALANKKMEWYAAMDSLYNYYIATASYDKAKTVAEGLVLEYPDDPVFALKTGTLYGKLNKYDGAFFYLNKSFELAPSPDLAKTLFVLCLKTDQPARAMKYLSAARGGAGNRQLLAVQSLVEQVIALEKKDTSDIGTVNAITQKYLQMGNKDGAIKYNEKALRINAADKEARNLQNQLKNE